MDVLKAHFGELRTLWEAVRGNISAQPETWKPYLISSSTEEINGTIAVLSDFLERRRGAEAPAPAHRLVGALMESSLKNALSSLKEIAEKGDRRRFPAFLIGLNQMLSAVHSMAAADGESVSREAGPGLFALAGEARRELGEMLDLPEQAGAIAREAEARLRQGDLPRGAAEDGEGGGEEGRRGTGTGKADG